MNQELTKAAQQALKVFKTYHDACNEVWVPGMDILEPDSDKAINELESALTQRPAAQTEGEGWTDADADAARLALELECLLLDTKDTASLSRWWASANDALDLHRARLAAPQQATPERHLTVTTNQQGEAVMVSWQDDEHRILEVVWERKQATPEPIPMVLHCPKCGMQHVDAPAVPEDSALLDYLDTLAARAAGSDPHCFGGRVVLYVRTGVGSHVQASGAGTAREAIRAAMLAAMLAAAQAKGADHA